LSEVKKRPRFGRQGVWLNHLTTATTFLNISLSFFTPSHFYFFSQLKKIALEASPVKFIFPL
jgi:hypothetical protein